MHDEVWPAISIGQAPDLECDQVPQEPRSTTIYLSMSRCISIVFRAFGDVAVKISEVRMLNNPCGLYVRPYNGRDRQDWINARQVYRVTHYP